jgi:hypothetical protein
MKQEMPLLILKDLFSCFLRATSATFRPYGAWGTTHRPSYKHPAPLEPRKTPLFKKTLKIRASIQGEKCG